MRHAARGMTLVELMIAVALGLLLMATVMSALISSSTASTLVSARQRLDSDGQLALAMLAQQIRMAGSNPDRVDASGQPVMAPPLSWTGRIRGCDGSFTTVAAGAGTTVGDLGCTPGGPHSLAIVYQADSLNTVSTVAGTPTDCLGSSLPDRTPAGTAAGVSFREADNRYLIAQTNTSTVPTLSCATRDQTGGGTLRTGPVLEQVADLQVRYAYSDPASPGLMQAYVSAATVSGAATTATDLADRWARVSAVEVCVLLQSAAPVVPSGTPNQYLDCAGTWVTAPDRRLRVAYTSVIALRNAL